MKQILLLFLYLTMSTMLVSQTARLQVIHNSPTPNVDIYVNGDLLLDNFVFRNATPFIDVPAEVNLEVGVAPANSNSAADAIATFNFNLEDGRTYIAIANGIVGGTPGFNIEVFDMGQETVGANNVGLMFFHGSPDAPEVDIIAGGAPIFDNVEFGEFVDYLELPAAAYTVGVTPANDNSNVIAEYSKDFEFWKGKTAVIFASGFLSGDFPVFEPWVALSNGGTFPLDFVAPVVPTARLQLIHNSPTPNVDIYVNGDLLLDNFVFRNATPFIDVPAGVDLEVGVAPANSNSAADAIATFTYNLVENETYIAIANGIVGGTPGFNIEVFDMGEETVGANNVGLMFFHGSPDAPEVDIIAGGAPIFDDVEYGEFVDYLELPAAAYTVGVTPANDNSNVIAEYSKDFEFWKGKTAVIFASGFLSGDFPAFEPWVALSNGGTFPLDLVVPAIPTARLQLIHNSPTPNVDIYVNGDLLLDNFVFRTATPFIDVPAGVNLEVGVAPANSNSAADAIATFDYNLMEGETYIAIANGIVGGNPGFNIEVFDMGMETVGADNVGLMFFHGSPDAPEVDIIAGGAPIFDDVEYGEFVDYLELPAGAYTVGVTPADNNANVIAEYSKDFEFWKGQTAVIFASGFLSGDFPAFKPYVALSNGGTFPLDQVGGSHLISNPQNSTVLNNNSLTDRIAVDVFPNPVVDVFQVKIDLEEETDVEALLFNNLGQVVQVKDYGLMYKGENYLDWSIRDANTGVYFLQIRTSTGVTTKQLQVLR
ncbi:MAG: DUF4397 domain-containing protein [Bacteroidota bacterium]